jgi:hypothetical protein
MRRDHEGAYRLWLAVAVAIAIIEMALLVHCAIASQP